jgi:hypothetical protein
MKIVKLLASALACMLLIKCTQSHKMHFSQIQSPKKFNGKVVNNIYYDDIFKYKIEIPKDWSLFDDNDLSRVGIPYKYGTFLVGFKSEKNAIYFYDDDLTEYNNYPDSLLSDCKRNWTETLTKMAKQNGAFIIMSQNYQIDNCFEGFDMTLYDKTTHTFDLSTSVFCRSYNTNHAVVGVDIIFNKDKQPVMKETLDYICIN